MIANGRPFSFVSAQMRLRIPFFQRGYVWDEDNWSELLENLESEGRHFLGSILLKDEQVASGELQTKLVIDGQQRMTTLSILVRALYDTIEPTVESIEQKIALKTIMKNLLFTPQGYTDEDPVIKLESSYLDVKSYTSVIKGEYADKWEQQNEY